MISTAPKLSDKRREEGGKIIRAIWIEWAKKQERPKPDWLLLWEELSEPMREVDRQIFELATAPLRLKVARQAEEMSGLWDIYFKSYELAGGKPDDCLHALPLLIDRFRRLLIRAHCGCVALDCVKHGAYVSDDVDFWQTVIKGDYPAYESLRDPKPPKPPNPPEALTRG